MRNGWIKLHTRFTSNEVWRRDPTAWRVFEYLLSEAFYGNPQGTTSTTRYQIGNACLVNNNTAWSALLRLKKAKMVNISTNYRYSTISICNWDKYQGDRQQPGQQLVNSSSLTHQHSYKNKNKIKNNTNVLVEAQSAYDLYCELFNKNSNTYKLTDKRKTKLKLRIKQNGLEQVKEAIRNTAESDFHRGDNDRGWVADLDFIIRSEEQVEKLANMNIKSVTMKGDW